MTNRSMRSSDPSTIEELKTKEKIIKIDYLIWYK